jgi:hypothetical protein
MVYVASTVEKQRQLFHCSRHFLNDVKQQFFRGVGIPKAANHLLKVVAQPWVKTVIATPRWCSLWLTILHGHGFSPCPFMHSD